jgi:hypothetical protein
MVGKNPHFGMDMGMDNYPQNWTDMGIYIFILIILLYNNIYKPILKRKMLICKKLTNKKEKNES